MANTPSPYPTLTRDIGPQIILVVVLVVIALLLFLFVHPAIPTPEQRLAFAYALSLLMGAGVGATELIARYRDRPTAALGTTPAGIYMAVNGAASLIAFWLLQTNRLSLNMSLFGASHQTLSNLVFAGFGAMALFRSSVFSVKVGDTTVSVGPSALLQVILRVADREVDRQRAGPRAARISRIMAGVIYQRARDALPLHCYALMQNVTLEEQNNLEQSLAILEKRSSLGDEAKAYSLGLLLMNLVGEDVLEQAVTGLGGRIKGPPPDSPAVLSWANNLKPADLPAILSACQAFEGPPPGDESTTEQRAARESKDGSLIAKPVLANEGQPRESDWVVIALAALRRRFGPETVSDALQSIIAARGRNKTTVPPDASELGEDHSKSN